MVGPKNIYGHSGRRGKEATIVAKTILERLIELEESPALSFADQLEVQYRLYILKTTKILKIKIAELETLYDVSEHKQKVFRMKDQMLLLDSKRSKAEATASWVKLKNWLQSNLEGFKIVGSVEEYRTEILDLIKKAEKNWWTTRQEMCPLEI